MALRSMRICFQDWLRYCEGEFFKKFVTNFVFMKKGWND